MAFRRRQVYNKYLYSDFTVGQDNLNPVHEDKLREDAAEEYRAELSEILQKRLKDREDLKAVVKKGK